MGAGHGGKGALAALAVVRGIAGIAETVALLYGRVRGVGRGARLACAAESAAAALARLRRHGREGSERLSMGATRMSRRWNAARGGDQGVGSRRGFQARDWRGAGGAPSHEFDAQASCCRSRACRGGRTSQWSSNSDEHHGSHRSSGESSAIDDLQEQKLQAAHLHVVQCASRYSTLQNGWQSR